MKLYNDPGDYGEKFRDAMDDFDDEDHRLYLIEGLSRTSERGVYSAADKVRKAVQSSDYEKK